MTVFETYVTIARGMGSDPGAIQPGFYVVEGDTVTLTSPEGAALASGRLQLGYSAKITDGENQTQVARRLIWRHYRATKSGSDFNRKIYYQPCGRA